MMLASQTHPPQMTNNMYGPEQHLQTDLMHIATETNNINITTTNNFTNLYLGIDEFLRRTRERITAEESERWEGTTKFMLWNATGLMPNLDRVVRKLITDDIHFAIVVETWLHPERAIPKICKDTSVVCTVHPVGYQRGKNGISLIINPNHAHHPALKNTQILARDTLNGTYLLAQIGNVKFLCIYYPPSTASEINTWLDEVLIACKLSYTDDLVILGDFNARLREWNDHNQNPRGLILKEWMDARGLLRINTGPRPTYESVSGHSIIDHIFTSLSQVHAETSDPIVNTYGHRPIIAVIPITPSLSPTLPKYMRLKTERLRNDEIKQTLMHRLNIAIVPFRAKLDEMSESWNSNTSGQPETQARIDSLDKLLTITLLRTSKEVLGEKVCGKRIIKHDFLESPALELIEAAIATAPSHEAIRELLNQHYIESNKVKNQRFNEFAHEASTLPASDLMKLTSSILTNRKKQHYALNSTDEALGRYRKHFQSMNQNSLPPPNRTVEPILNHSPDPISLNDLLHEHIAPSTLHEILKWIPRNKSPGASGVTYDILKTADFPVLSAISRFFNLMLTTRCTPSSWKRALIVPVPKKGDLCDIKNYRPISLTEPLRKLFEHCMLRMVNQNAGPTSLTQGGFRTNHCCNDMIVVLHDILKSKKGKLHVAFLDIRAAYDSVDRRILWRRCRNRGLSTDSILMLRELFDHNSGQVVVGGRRSEPFHIEAGVLQGSVLSPCLYSLFIDDLAKTLQSHPKIEIGNAKINCTMYADDIALFAETQEELQTLLNVCADHARQNRYRFNAAKCEVITDLQCVFKIDNDTLPHCSSFKYLGVELNRSGIDIKAFTDRRVNETKRAAEKLSGMGMNVGGFSISASSLLYRVFIRPKLEASMCILPPFKHISQKLEKAQSAILRRILRAGINASNVIIRSLLQIPSMSHRVKWLRSKYIVRFDQTIEPEHILKKCSNRRKPWIDTLRKECYPPEYDRTSAWAEELDRNHDEVRLSTQGFLDIPTEKKLPWFLRHKIDQKVSRPIINWILKRYPGREPPICATCLTHRATQEHMASCNNLLSNLFHDIPARFRPEAFLSQTPIPQDPSEALIDLARAIAYCVQSSIPDLSFSILSE